MPLLWWQTNGLASRGEVGLMRGCLCCPCHEWSIAVVCYREHPCGEAGKYLDCTNDIDLTTDDNCDQSLVDGVAGIVSGTIIDNIRLKDWTPDHTGTATFTAKINGDIVATESVGVTQGVPYTWGTDAWQEPLPLTGWNRVVVGISLLWEDEEEEEQTQTLEFCRCVYNYPLSSSLIHALAIVPSVVAEQCITDNRALYKLKGPFNTRADAEYVLDQWDEFIGAYASTCACQFGCGPGDGEGGDAKWEPGFSPVDITDQFDELWSGFLIGNCEWQRRVTVDFFFKTSDDKILIVDWNNGSILWDESDGITEFVIPPCSDVKIIAVGGNGGEAAMQCSGGTEGMNVCARDDPESPFYGEEWAYTPWEEGNPPTGVPNNSEDLANWIAYQKSLE